MPSLVMLMKDALTFGVIIEKQAEDPLSLGGGMNAVPTAFETEAKSISS
jgi:hypothetical protein